MNRDFKFHQLKIAGMHFIITADKGIKLFSADRHKNFKSNGLYPQNPWEQTIRLYYCDYYPEPDSSPNTIWEACEGDYSWKVFDYIGETVIYVYYPDLESPVVLSLNPRRLDKPILVNHPGKEIEILKYPIDLILLHYFSIPAELIMVHASGFVLDNTGFVCLGRSGSGKTTLAKLATDAGGRRIQDDRLLIRKENSDWFMYPVPLHAEDHQCKAKIDRILTLNHAQSNQLIPLKDEQRTSLFLPHISHFPKWRNNYMYQMILAEQLLKNVRFHQFFFLPNQTAVKHLENDGSFRSVNHNSSKELMQDQIKDKRVEHDPTYLSK